VVVVWVAGKRAHRSRQGQPQMPSSAEEQPVQDVQVFSSLQYSPWPQWASHWQLSAVLRHFVGQTPPSNGSPHCQQPSHS
jgi:hypothetical protein